LIDTNASGTKILNSELVHSSPNNVSGGSITWSFDWQAPSTPGNYTIFATGLSGDGNGGTSGDSTGATSLQITVAQATNQSPVAVISAPTSGAEGVAVSFNGSGSSDPDGTIASYDWDFGDGSNATGSQVTHAFAAGTYTVTLTVTDNTGATGNTSMQIQIAATNVPPVAAISGPSNGTEGISVSLDGSGSTDSDGNIVSYDWDFGDNSAGSGVTASHVYAAGTYTVTLMVTDNGGDIDHATLNITIVPATNPQPPVADAGGPYNGTVGIAVQFDGSTSTDPDGSVTNYAWDFGDGNSGTGVGPVHIYNAPGNYTVQLTVTDDSGDTGNSQTTADIVAVAPPPQSPVADAGGPYNGSVGVAVQFDGSASSDPDGNVASYAWNFGDGNTGTGVSPSHTYTTAGTYTVQLTVTDDSGNTNSSQSTAFIAAAEPPPPPPPTDTNGETLYNTYCASCHGAKGTYEFRREVGGEDAGDIREGIEEERDMAFLDNILTRDDIDAIAAYINDEAPPGDGGDTDPPPTDGGDTDPPPTDGGGTTPPPTDGGGTTNPNGEALYNTYCASCHGAKTNVSGTTANGISAAINQFRSMNSLGNDLTQADIDAIAAYINDQAPPPTDGGGTTPPPTDGGDTTPPPTGGDGDDSSDDAADGDDEEKPSDMSESNPFVDEESADTNKLSAEELGVGALNWLVLALAAVMVHRRRRNGRV